MAWKKAIIAKSGSISRRRISSKNLRENYRPVGEAKIEGKWRIVYGRRNREIIPKTKFKLRQLKAIREKPITGMLTKEEIEHPKVEVTGLVGVYYDGEFFHAELLFKWYGRGTFDAEVLLDEAVQILLSELPNIERISYELVASPLMHEDIRVRGIGEVIRYDGQRVNEMDYQIFIPKAGSRCLWAGSTRVDA